MLFPPPISSLASWMACSNTALPTMFFTISRAVRIGTPLELSVSRVRANLPTTIFLTSPPTTGIRSLSRSMERRPRLVHP